MEDHVSDNPVEYSSIETENGDRLHEFIFMTTEGIPFTVWVKDIPGDVAESKPGVFTSNYAGVTRISHDGILQLLEDPDHIPEDGFTPLVFCLYSLIKVLEERGDLYVLGRESTYYHVFGVPEEVVTLIEKFAIKVKLDGTTGKYRLVMNPQNISKFKQAQAEFLWHTAGPIQSQNGLIPLSLGEGSAEAYRRAWETASAINLTPIILLERNSILVDFQRLQLPPFADHAGREEGEKIQIAKHIGILCMALIAFKLPEDQRGEIIDPLSVISKELHDLDEMSVDLRSLNEWLP